MSYADRRTEAFDGSREERSLALRWIRDHARSPERLTVFDPHPARLDTAWIEIDDRSVVSLRAMR